MVPPPVLVTSRAEKALEAKRLGFALVCVPRTLPEPQALDPGEIVETKARAAHAILQRPVIVEDSGLSIGAWEGVPGALIKWLERSAGVAAFPRTLGGLRDCVLRRISNRDRSRGGGGTDRLDSARQRRLRLGCALRSGRKRAHL